LVESVGHGSSFLKMRELRIPVGGEAHPAGLNNLHLRRGYGTRPPWRCEAGRIGRRGGFRGAAFTTGAAGMMLKTSAAMA